MAKIRVHLLNFHGITSHIEIVLENKSANPSTFYRIDRWSEPRFDFYPAEHFFKFASDDWSIPWDKSISTDMYFKKAMQSIGSTCHFDIEANPSKIVEEWGKYYDYYPGSLITNNCANAVQWFLEVFADIKPFYFNASLKLNHVALGLFVPQCVPIGISLPGRVMDNVKEQLSARESKPALEMSAKRL